VVGPVVVLAHTTPAPPPAEEGSSADPRFRGPRLFRGNIDEPRTPKPGVRATEPVDFQSGVPVSIPDSSQLPR